MDFTKKSQYMNITNKYKRIDKDIVAYYISRDCKAHGYTIPYVILEDILISLEYTVVEKVEPIKSHPLYRMTVPLLMLVILLIWLYMPVKWLLTGKGRLSGEGKLVKFLQSWASKTGLEI